MNPSELDSGTLTLITSEPEPVGIDIFPGESSSSAAGDDELLVRLRLGDAMDQVSGLSVSVPASCRLVTRETCGESAAAKSSARDSVPSCPTVGVEIVSLTLVVGLRLLVLLLSCC
jgi:hypothetical protein